MFRPTPIRIIYLIVGLVIGAAVFLAVTSVVGTPSFLSSVVPIVQPSSHASQKVPAAFSGKTLDRVLAVNQEATKNGVEVRVNTLEEYSDGFALTYSIMGGQAGEPAPTLQPTRFVVSDDLGNQYYLSPLGSAATVGPGFSSGYLAFSPSLDQAAKSLTVTVPHLTIVSNASASNEPKIIDGPWQVRVVLQK